MKRLIINILLKCLNRVGYCPVYFRTIEINQTNLERIELRFENKIKCPPHIIDEYISRETKAIPYQMSKKLVDVIEQNMLCEVSEPNQFSPYPTIHARMDIYIKSKQNG